MGRWTTSVAVGVYAAIAVPALVVGSCLVASLVLVLARGLVSFWITLPLWLQLTSAFSGVLVGILVSSIGHDR